MWPAWRFRAVSFRLKFDCYLNSVFASGPYRRIVMSQSALKIPSDMEEVITEVEAYMETLVTEDDEPVDNIYSDIQRRLLVEPLRSSWRPLDENGAPRKYLACTDVGIFYALRHPPIAPDMLLSMDVEPPEEFWLKKHRSYFTWEYGKAPDVVIEVVSNREGGETGVKLRDYAIIGIPYYVVFDPGRFLGDDALRIFKLDARRYVAYHENHFPEVGLGLTLWEGSYEDSKPTTWLRWRDAQGDLIATGAEQAERARREAERARREAERAASLAEKLRELGVDPDSIAPGERR